jgi:hypothetical protein
MCYMLYLLATNILIYDQRLDADSLEFFFWTNTLSCVSSVARGYPG